MSEKTILVAGASGGIGRAVALALAGPGVRLTLAARSAERLEATAAAVRGAGATALVLPGDLTDEAEVVRLVEVAAGPDGRLDVAIHSVGGALVKPLAEIGLAEWDESLRGQLTSLFLLVKHAAALMGPGGLIVSIGSVAARQAFPGWAAYTAAKHGALGLMAAAREELRPRGVRVSSVLPAATDTALWDGVPGDWNRDTMLRPEDVAAAVAGLVAAPPHVTVEDLTIGHRNGRL